MDIEARVSKLESYARTRGYAGYSKFDALNSPLLSLFFGKTYFTRLLVTQFVNRVPLPLRSLLGVRPSRNPKGIANFVRGYCLRPTSEQMDSTIRKLSDWLLSNHSAKFHVYGGPGLAWGYNFPWQSPGFFAPRHAPNCIVTVFVGEALLDAYQRTGEHKYLEGARGASRFLLEALPVLEEDASKKCIGYVTEGLRWKVVNINAVTAGFLSRLSDQIPGPYLDEAQKMVRWVCSVQQPDHSWNYTEPLSQSGIGPDNYHTGGILDGLLETAIRSEDPSLMQTWRQGMEFYREHFFEDDGAPKWRVHRSYPQDIHGAAQGILSFSRGARKEPAYLDVANRIVKWAVENMQGPHGGFYYQRRRGWTWKLELMRWNNSWMFWALNESQRANAALKEYRRVGT